MKFSWKNDGKMTKIDWKFCVYYKSGYNIPWSQKSGYNILGVYTPILTQYFPSYFTWHRSLSGPQKIRVFCEHVALHKCHVSKYTNVTIYLHCVFLTGMFIVYVNFSCIWHWYVWHKSNIHINFSFKKMSHDPLPLSFSKIVIRLSFFSHFKNCRTTRKFGNDHICDTVVFVQLSNMCSMC